MEVSVVNPLFYFKLFYVLAFLFICFAVLYQGIKRGYQIQSILLMLSTITLFTVIGTRLVTIPVEEWIQIIFSNAEVIYDNRSALGGLLFGLVGLIISQRLLGFHKPILDVYAWAVPVGLGIQKIGCFINGCCFGKPSELFWAVHYPHGSQAHYSQWVSGFINQDEAFSMSVHPVQLYETIGLFLLGFTIWRTRYYWKKNLSVLLFSMVLFLFFRFLIEFIRDPASSQFEVIYTYGIKNLQWMLLIIAFLVALTLFIYEKYLKWDTVKVRKYNYNLKVDLILTILLSFIIYIFSNLLTQYELLSVWIKFIPATLLTLYYIFRKSEYTIYRLALSILLFIPIFVFAQTYEKDSLTTKKFRQLDIGGSFGDFYNEVLYNPRSGECGTSYDHEYLKNSYNIGGIGYSQVTRKGSKENTFGVNLHGGNIKTTRLSTGDVESNFTFGLNPFYKHEGKWLGIGAGFQLGNLRKNTTDKVKSGDLSKAIKKHFILPEFYLRLGRRDWFDIDYNYGFLMPSAFPTTYSRVSMGSSFGLGPDYNLRYGKIYPINSDFISARAMLTDHIGVNLMYVLKEKNRVYNDEASSKILFSINYRFDFKTN